MSGCSPIRTSSPSPRPGSTPSGRTLSRHRGISASPRAGAPRRDSSTGPTPRFRHRRRTHSARRFPPATTRHPSPASTPARPTGGRSSRATASTGPKRPWPRSGRATWSLREASRSASRSRFPATRGRRRWRTSRSSCGSRRASPPASTTATVRRTARTCASRPRTARCSRTRSSRGIRTACPTSGSRFRPSRERRRRSTCSTGRTPPRCPPSTRPTSGRATRS